MINEQQAHKFCKDSLSKIENYDIANADLTQAWDIHHRLEFTLDGEFAHTRDELKRLGMYFHRPYFELIFLPHGEHSRLHNKGKTLTSVSRKKLSECNKGKHLDAEHRMKLSESHKGKTFTAETRKKMTASLKAYWARYKQEGISCADLI